jgi:hypothetical protein
MSFRKQGTERVGTTRKSDELSHYSGAKVTEESTEFCSQIHSP